MIGKGDLENETHISILTGTLLGMAMLEQNPERVINYFLDKRVKYAALNTSLGLINNYYLSSSMSLSRIHHRPLSTQLHSAQN
jgi:hypothetical protein